MFSQYLFLGMENPSRSNERLCEVREKRIFAAVTREIPTVDGAGTHDSRSSRMHSR